MFSEQLCKHADMPCFILNQAAYSPQNLEELANNLKQRSVVIVSIHHIQGNQANQFGLEEGVLGFLKALQDQGVKVIIVPFGNVYSLSLYKDFKHIIAAYEDDSVAHHVVPQILFGVLPAMGKLPVSIPGAWPAGWGL